MLTRAMASTRHYETAFDAYLRRRRAPYCSVRVARRALFGETARIRHRAPGAPEPATLKTFDFVLYGDPTHTLIEIKGRRIAPKPGAAPGSAVRTESWVTLDDIESLRTWQGLFGPAYRAMLVFLYWCERPDAASVFDERFEHDGRLYGLRAIDLADYTAAMVTRSPRWRTVHLPTAAFDRLSGPLLGPEPRPAHAFPGTTPAPRPEVITRPTAPAALARTP